jgi:hypothetical protein
MSPSAIGRQMGMNESSVRSLSAPGRAEKADTLKLTADMLQASGRREGIHRRRVKRREGAADPTRRPRSGSATTSSNTALSILKGGLPGPHLEDPSSGHRRVHHLQGARQAWEPHRRTCSSTETRFVSSLSVRRTAVVPTTISKPPLNISQAMGFATRKMAALTQMA